MAASTRLQHHINLLVAWATKRKIKINETKSTQVRFTSRRNQCPPIVFNNISIPESPSFRYLGMHMDKKLNWREHIAKKRKQIGLKFKQLYWLLGRKITIIPGKQSPSIQDCYKTHMDVWHRNMG
jgi:hypothetical protein